MEGAFVRQSKAGTMRQYARLHPVDDEFFMVLNGNAKRTVPLVGGTSQAKVFFLPWQLCVKWLLSLSS